MVEPEIVLGPPGTGKTTTLLGIVDDELKTTPPNKVGYFSFTKRAAHEAVSRAVKKFSLEERDLPHFRTLHSMCFRSLGMSGSDVFEGNRIREFSQYIGVKLTGRFNLEEGGTFGFEEGDRILFMENLARVRRVPLREQYDLDDDGLSWHNVERVADGLVKFKRHHALLDYTDMLQRFIVARNDLNLEVLLVDEAQDLSALQWEVVKRLAQTVRRYVVAGDDDQAIYKWAGADLEQFVTMPGRDRVLGQSWRVPSSIQQLSSAIISGVSLRREKTWAPRPDVGVLDRVADFEQADTSGSDVLILARNNFILREQVEPVLRKQGALFEFRGHSSVRPSVLTAIVNWEELRKGNEILADEARQVYEMMTSTVGVKRGYKTLPGFTEDEPVNMELLKQRGGLLVDSIWHEALDRIPTEEMSYIVAARTRGESFRKKPRIRLSTIHGAKGGEADHVILMTEMARRTHHEAKHNPEDEARVWYVAVTRARERLTIVGTKSAFYYSI